MAVSTASAPVFLCLAEKLGDAATLGEPCHIRNNESHIWHTGHTHHCKTPVSSTSTSEPAQSKRPGSLGDSVPDSTRSLINCQTTDKKDEGIYTPPKSRDIPSPRDPRLLPRRPSRIPQAGDDNCVPSSAVPSPWLRRSKRS